MVSKLKHTPLAKKRSANKIANREKCLKNLRETRR
jgi:hypothetical protein